MMFKLWALLGIVGAAPVLAYDLPADVATRRAEAKQELGKRTAVQTVQEVFVLITPPGAGDAGTSAFAEQVLNAYFNGRFSKRPTEAISVYLFPEQKSYEAYCKQRWSEPCGTPYGFYRHAERRIVMNAGPGIGTLTHELVHPIMQTDFPGAPEWLNEGVASLFEALVMPAKGEIHGVKNWRHPRLLRALRSEKERASASLPALLALSDSEFRNQDEDLHYAAARYLCLWLDQQNKLWPFYRRFRDNHDTDATGAQAFRDITGQTPAEANAAWVQWVKRL